MKTQESATSSKRMVDLGIGNEKVPLGSHICLLYRTESERDNISIPFITKGLEYNASCKYVVSEQTAAQLCGSLTALGLNVSRFQASGQFKILSAQETYLPTDSFNYHEMINQLEKLSKEVVDQGYSYLRYTAETTFLHDNVPEFENFMEYESVLNNYITSFPLIAICQYNITKFNGDIILAVLQTHPYAIMGGVLIKNPYYIPPKEFLNSNYGKITE